MMRDMDRIRKLLLSVSLACITPNLLANPNSPAYSVNGKTFTLSDVSKKDENAYYELEKKKYDLVFESAREEYLKQFWADLAKTKKMTPAQVRDAYIKERVKVKDAEITEILTKFKDHPQLSKLPMEERKKQVRDYLVSRESQKVFENIIDEAIKNKKLEIFYPKPKEPVFDIKVSEDEPVRYGPKPSDVKPVSCKGDACPITVVEYSEFQCPFCDRMLPDTTKVLETYKGKIRWIVRDFPLDFHPRAIPAALAAKCAHFQGKYWDMYYSIYKNQKELSDEDLIKRAEKLKLDMNKFKQCFNTPKDVTAQSDWKKADDMIHENMSSGMKFGVRGTPAFFIQGRMLSGALPFEEFKRVIDEELAKKNG